MSGKNISRIHRLQALALACLIGTLSSCSSNEVNGDAPSLPVSEASLLSDSEKADSQTDSTIFADLEPGKDKQNSAAADPSAGPFYNAIGGESLGRVAYTLYGDRSFRKQLLEKNSGLPSKLSSGQPVYFDFADVKPQPTFLTKDLLDRYPNELSEKLKMVSANGTLTQGSVTLQPGETLQKLSERLYGTTRYWTELYLLNHDKIKHYDKVPAGLTLATYDHGSSPVANTAPAPAPEAQEAESAPVKEAMNSQMAPVVQPTMDPIPETPEAEVAAPAPTPITQSAAVNSLTAPASTSILDVIGDGSNANVRRIIYVLLIVGIGGLAFYFTRPSRKQKIDMLDVTAGSTAPSPRSKLGKENNRKSIG